MRSKRFKVRQTELQYIKFLDQNDLKWNYGVI